MMDRSEAYWFGECLISLTKEVTADVVRVDISTAITAKSYA
jgi:hypothetical protein